ncbi:MAG: SPFH domain-containing protein [Bacteroidales bacterium]|nr:SPFH domain-containing protein [Bacteroidales bacterium]MCD8395117.1 SPFH domain-containing protein [Bacteroidales bacterium]
MNKNSEYNYKGMIINGFLMLVVEIGMLVGGGFLIANETVASFILGGLMLLAAIIVPIGFVMLEPNQACVLIFFGKYKGTFEKAGYYWVNPFMTKKKLSLRFDNLDIQPIKVNDKAGNPVMIGMVLVWRLQDTYKAVFDLDTQGSTSIHVYRSFVEIQGNAALREVAGQYAYDNDGNPDELTLRSGGSEINELLERKINERLAIAGIKVVEARINYLAYAPEIAAVMLKRQQAAAIISAREKIVEGAVTTVKMALEHLEGDKVVKLGDDQKASIVGNLLVVLCSDEAAQPVIPTR